MGRKNYAGGYSAIVEFILEASVYGSLKGAKEDDRRYETSLREQKYEKYEVPTCLLYGS
jgi:hypothetical protein